MAGKHLVITCTLTVKNQEISTDVRIDCGATGIAFMHQDFAHLHQIPLQGVKEKRHVEVIDRRPIESGDITHIATMGMMIQDHKAQLPMFVTKLGYYPILVGITWLRLHDVAVRFASNTVTFVSQYCTTYCHDVPIRVQGVSAEPRDPVYPKDRAIFEPQIRPQRSFRGNIVMLNGSSFPRTVQKGKLKIFKASLYDMNKAIEAKELKERSLEEIVPEQYHEFLSLFHKVSADRLPPR